MTMMCDVLVVDDDVSIAKLVASVLSDDGHHVDSVHNGEEALELFRKNYYALVISDIVMPGINGIELLKQIKQINAETQVIIMTSHANLNSAIEALRAGAYDFLTKPFDDLSVISLVVRRTAEKIDLIQQNRILLEDLKLKNDEANMMHDVLRGIAIQDGLTGLVNQRYFHELLGAEIDRSKRYNHSFSLQFMVIDHFVRFIDTNGQPTGDKALRDIAELLKKNTRKSNVKARYSFDQFAMIMPEMSREEALTFAERTRLLIADHPFIGRETQPGGMLTISIGVASFPNDGIDRKSLIDHARQSLATAKNTGKNRVC